MQTAGGRSGKDRCFAHVKSGSTRTCWSACCARSASSAHNAINARRRIATSVVRELARSSVWQCSGLHTARRSCQ
jgi:hypothetical protein